MVIPLRMNLFDVYKTNVPFWGLETLPFLTAEIDDGNSVGTDDLGLWLLEYSFTILNMICLHSEWFSSLPGFV